MSVTNTAIPGRILQLATNDIVAGIKDTLKREVVAKVLADIDPMLDEAVDKVCEGIEAHVYQLAQQSFVSEFKLVVEKRGFST